MESNYRRALQVAGGDHSIFIDDPVSAGLLFAAVLFVVISLWRNWLHSKKTSEAEAQAAAG